MKGFIYRCAGVLTALVIFSGAHAATVVLDGTRATDVLGLQANGTTYNVTFGQDSYNNLVGSGGFIFLGSQTQATNAANALNAALNTTTADNVGSATLARIGYHVPYETTASVALALRSRLTDGTWQYFDLRFLDLDFPSPSYALFTEVSTVPVPAAFWLFGSGLGLLGWLGRKQL